MDLKLNDNNYPKLLKEIFDPPKTLYYKGDPEILNTSCIAIVGTRKCSKYGEYLTKKIIKELQIADVTIVSGLAKGIDTIAHEESLKLEMRTIAVLGSGLESIYPKSNVELAKKIGERGMVISEYEPETQPKNFYFPQRNRIISGISIATVVIEAPEKSGALITARLALEQGREIFVIPGDIDRKNSFGILKLLQKGGAYPISSGKEIIEMLNLKAKKMEKIKRESKQIKYKLTEEEESVMKVLSKIRGNTLDNIKIKNNYTTSQILSILSFLEIQGLIETKDGKYFLNC
jgi:DNA processing protein